MKPGYSLDVIYPDTATRPAYCANCEHDQTDHMGVTNGAWCGIENRQQPANHECHLMGMYVEREQSPEELAHLAEITKGSAFARLSKQLVAAAAEGERELVEFSPGLFMSPTPGKNVAATDYTRKEGAA